MSDLIRIVDQEVFYRVGVPAAERAQAQRLLITLELALDVTAAARKDDLNLTINYSSIARGLLEFGEGREWCLIETLAVDLAEWVLGQFGPPSVVVEVKKFVLPKAAYVAVRIERASEALTRPQP